ncbi:Cytochrome [Burkholderiales bacterium 8X]|nr:Cytochrome [Burkholderiales bacterium 8X]
MHDDLPPPKDALDAVTHPDPYPWYASLRAGPPLVFDAALGLWVASSAEAVESLLGHASLRVRPAAEPVPRNIASSPAGEVFGYLVRMNDGPQHASMRPVLQHALAAVDPMRFREATRIAAAQMPDGSGASSSALQRWCNGLAVRSVGQLLGFEETALTDVDAWTQDFVACLSPLSKSDERQVASNAAEALMSRFEALCHAPLAASNEGSGSLLASIRRAWPDSRLPRSWLANLVGLLSQTCEATAALLANSWVALGREPGLPVPALQGRHGFEALVAEVARHDAPIQNTRRFACEPLSIGDIRVEAGDAILLILAAANRDPASNPAPDDFLLDRAARRQFGFGHGPHACPGQAMAFGIVAAGIEALLERGFEPHEQATRGWHYRPSVNARLPVFH